MAPLHDHVFQRVIRTIPIDGTPKMTRNLLFLPVLSRCYRVAVSPASATSVLLTVVDTCCLPKILSVLRQNRLYFR